MYMCSPPPRTRASSAGWPVGIVGSGLSAKSPKVQTSKRFNVQTSQNPEFQVEGAFDFWTFRLLDFQSVGL